MDGITKFYFRLQELSRSDAATVHETLEKWWSGERCKNRRGCLASNSLGREARAEIGKVF